MIVLLQFSAAKQVYVRTYHIGLVSVHSLPDSIDDAEDDDDDDGDSKKNDNYDNDNNTNDAEKHKEEKRQNVR